METKILVVDDDPEILTLVGAVLEGKDFAVTTAENGVIALKCLQKQSFHLIVSDILMPELDGIELLRTVRSDPGLRKMPFILLTQKDDFEDIQTSYDLNVDYYLAKPFDQGAVLDAIYTVLGN